MKDIFVFWLIVLVSVLVVYVLPSFFNLFFFAALAVSTVLNNKYSYLFIALWFFFIDAPGDLFLGETFNDPRQLPILAVPGGGFISIREVFPLLFLIGIAIKRNRKVVFLFDSYLKILAIFFFFNLVYSALWGISANALFNIVLISLKLSLFYSIPRLLNEELLIRFDRILFSVLLIAFLTQILTLLTGLRVVDFFSGAGAPSGDNLLLISEERAARVFNSPYITIYALFRSLYYMISSNKKFSQSYLSLIIVLSSVMIVLSATRGWILALLVSFAFVIIIFSKIRSVRRVTTITISFVVFIFVIQFFIPLLSVQFSNSLDRFLTLGKLTEGDLSMEGDLYRVTDRAPRLLGVFSENPVFGWGYSNVYWQNRDRHVGHANILMTHGIVGTLVLYIFYIIFLAKMSTLRITRSEHEGMNGNAPRILALGLVFVMIIHSTSHQFWGYDLEIGPTFFLVSLFSSWQILFLSKKRSSTFYRSNSDGLN